MVSQPGTPPAGEQRRRRDSEPEPRAHQALVCDAQRYRDHDQRTRLPAARPLTWPQIASWIDAGMTPARLGLIIIADRLSVFCRSHRDELIAAGKCDPDAAATELAQIRDDAIATVVDRGPSHPRCRRARPASPLRASLPSTRPP